MFLFIRFVPFGQDGFSVASLSHAGCNCPTTSWLFHRKDLSRVDWGLIEKLP